MKNKIITISREYGSGGRFIGEEVANELGFAYYDKVIIMKVAKQTGFDVFKAIKEKTYKNYFFELK